jgi:hypothetical protein
MMKQICDLLVSLWHLVCYSIPHVTFCCYTVDFLSLPLLKWSSTMFSVHISITSLIFLANYNTKNKYEFAFWT